MLDHPRVEGESARLEALAAARVAAVEYRHIVFLSHPVDGGEEAEEVLFGVDVLLAVGAEENVPAFLEAQTLVHIARLNLGEVLVQHLRHRAAGDVGPLLRQAAVCQIAACVLAVGHIYIGDYVHYPAVCLLRQALVLAAVACLHMEDRDMEPLGADDAEAAVGVAQHEDCIRPCGHHQLVACVYDVAAGCAQVVPHCVQIDLRVLQLEVLEEYSVEVVVVVLACMGENHVEISPCLVDDGGQADDLWSCAYDDQQLEPAVVCEMYL